MNTYPNFVSSVLVGTLLFNVALIGCGPDNGKRRQRIRKDQGVAGKQLGAKPAQAAAAATADPSKQPPAATADPSKQVGASPPDIQQKAQPGVVPGDSSALPPATKDTALVPPTGENQSVNAEIEKRLKVFQTDQAILVKDIPEGQFVLTKIFGKMTYEDIPNFQALLISNPICQDDTCSKVEFAQKEFLINYSNHGSPIPLTSKLTIPFVIKKDSAGLVAFEKDIGIKYDIENGNLGKDIGKLDQISSPTSGVSTNSGGVLAVTLNDSDTIPKIPGDSDGVTYKVGSGPDSGAEIVFAVAQNDGSEIRVFVDLPKKNKTISNFVLIYQKPSPSK